MTRMQAQEALIQQGREASGSRQPGLGRTSGLTSCPFPAALLPGGITGPVQGHLRTSRGNSPSWFAALVVALDKLQANSCDSGPQGSPAPCVTLPVSTLLFLKWQSRGGGWGWAMRREGAGPYQCWGPCICNPVI